MERPPIHYFSHDPEIQRFLFEHGAIPDSGKKELRLADIISDPQSVHTRIVVNHNNFMAEELFKAVKQSGTDLHKAAESYKSAIDRLFAQNKKLSIQLLDLTKQGKYIAMFETLKATPMPKDKIESIKKIWGAEVPAEALTWLKSDHVLLLEVLNGVSRSLEKSINSLKDEEGKEIAQTRASDIRQIIFDNTPAPDDDIFVKTVLSVVKDALNNIYLRKNSKGEYEGGYATEQMRYDRLTDSVKLTTTTPKSIGAVVEYIESSTPSLEQQRELVSTLLTKDPSNTKAKISRIRADLKKDDITIEQLTHKDKIQELLQGLDNKALSELFHHVSGMHIEPVWKEQQKFKLASQIYVANNTYGENRNACIQGTWEQIIHAVSEIEPRFEDSWHKYIEAQTNHDEIDTTNIDQVIETFADKLVSNLQGNYNAAEKLQDVFTMIDTKDTAQTITKEQTNMLSVINKSILDAWSEIKEIVTNHPTHIPTYKEYGMLLNYLPTNNTIVQFIASKLHQPEQQGVKNVETQSQLLPLEVVEEKIAKELVSPESSTTTNIPGPSTKNQNNQDLPMLSVSAADHHLPLLQREDTLNDHSEAVNIMGDT